MWKVTRYLDALSQSPHRLGPAGTKTHTHSRRPWGPLDRATNQPRQKSLNGLAMNITIYVGFAVLFMLFQCLAAVACVACAVVLWAERGLPRQACRRRTTASLGVILSVCRASSSSRACSAECFVEEAKSPRLQRRGLFKLPSERGSGRGPVGPLFSALPRRSMRDWGPDM